ncbi:MULTISPECIES: DUF2326 domain-containing protein [Cycloclasticus]|uniref:DUF2326 domain-containing protein n=1 Tax=Cycloclasticus pugetii TaxID=34068 RepID=A0AB33Z207_9GAMM|nr:MULTISPECIES: DUF2326 domain-containing protein [Cycloclasticus]ATI01952.1 DUF2326 domain-containing protein [Cycloclasticus sp. PY97N]EPD13307.1 hypothetical protein L196_06680 [Cycloclasticus pugetii]
MLIEVVCDKFRENKINFHSGLNVVLGDEKATNSIGKSSLLMVVDFVFGGNSLLEHNKDIVEELGEHEYCFCFRFDDQPYYFKRATFSSDLVYICDDAYEELEPISIEDYRSRLKKMYGLGGIDLTFRAIVSLYSRVWDKGNLDVKRPLHNNKNRKAVECIDDLLKLYKHYDSIKLLSKKVKELTDEKSAIRNAFKQKLITKITKKQYKENIHRVSEIDQEIRDIKDNLAKYAVNLSEIVNREVSELKSRKDGLLRERAKISTRLVRVRSDLDSNKHIKSKTFSSLIRFFPEVDQNRVSQVEEFHSKITKILKRELLESERELAEMLDEIDASLSDLDGELSQTFASLDKPDIIVDRVHNLASDRGAVAAEIRFFETDDQVDNGLKEAKLALAGEKTRILSFVESIINDKARKLVSKIYNEKRRSPILKLEQKNYDFSAIEDTGTGKAYSNLIVFDLSIFGTTSLPFIIHDSVLFKNVENEVVARMVDIYGGFEKQSFIAIDEIQKYGSDATKKLRDKKVTELSNQNVLYVKDWRK